MRRRRHVALAGLLIGALLGACSDDDSSDGASADTSAVPDTSEERPIPTGEPLLLGVIGDGPLATPPDENLEVSVAGAEAAAAAINDAGGVDGRPIEIVTCDTRADLNAAADCARDLIDQGVVALVGAASQVEAGFLPITDEEGIPSIGHFPVAEAGLTSQLTFPLVSGVPGLLIGQGILVAELERERPSVIRIDQDALAEAVALANMGLAANDLSVVNEVEIPPQAPDMSSYVAAATADDADSIIALMLPQDMVNFVTALRQAGSEAAVIASSNTIIEALDLGFGEELEGVYAVGWEKPATQLDDAAVEQFVTEMDAHDPDASKQVLSENGWASVHLFAELAAGLDDISPASLIAALETLEDYDPGVLPPVSFVEPQTLIPGLRLFNTSVLFTQVTDGDFVPTTGDFVDVFAAVAGG